MDLLARMGLLDYEATEDAPAPDAPAPAEPAPEPAAEPWAGPSQEEWQQAQAQLAEYRDFMAALQQPMYPDTEPEQPLELPAYDPFDAEAAMAHMDARDARILGAIQQMISPMTESHANQAATDWADQTFGRLGVPEEEHWRDGVLFASAGFQQFDQYGRPLVHPQQAAAQGYAF